MAKRARTKAEWREIAAIGAQLRQARKNAGLSQTALAAKLNVVQPDISDWERGVHLPDPRVIARWAKETKADLRDLLSSPCFAHSRPAAIQSPLVAVTTAAPQPAISKKPEMFADSA